jgi:predicted nuclease of predicted toxin-antitoxin system
VKLYLDEDISPKVSVILRKKGTDAVSAHEAGMLEASDEEQLSFAAAEGRALVTRNRDDFITLTVQFFEALKPHKGLIIVPHTIPGSEFSKLAALLVKFSKDHPQGLPSYTIGFLPSK